MFLIPLHNLQSLLYVGIKLALSTFMYQDKFFLCQFILFVEVFSFFFKPNESFFPTNNDCFTLYIWYEVNLHLKWHHFTKTVYMHSTWSDTPIPISVTSVGDSSGSLHVLNRSNQRGEKRREQCTLPSKNILNKDTKLHRGGNKGNANEILKRMELELLLT